MHSLSQSLERIQNLSLRYKLAGLFAALFMAISLSLYLYLPARFHAQAINVMTQNAIGVADGVAYGLAPAVYFDDRQGIAAVLKGAMLNKNLVDMEVDDSTSQCIGRTVCADSIAHNHSSHDSAAAVCIEENVFRVTKAITHDGTTIGKVAICFDLATLKNEEAASRRTIAVLCLLVLALGMLLIYLVSRLVTARLWKIVQVSDAVAQGDLTQRVEDHSADEIGKLATTFNHMVASVVHADQLGHELSERKRAQAETVRVKEYLQDIVNSTPAPLVVVDTAGRITVWNRILEQETGLSETELMQALAWEVIPILAGHSQIVVDAIKSGTLQKHERLMCKHCATPRYVDVLVYPLHGEDSGAVIRIDDVTEEVRMLELMAQTEKMMSVGGLAAGMAHEINNPLGIIVQSIQNIQRRIALDLAKNAEVAQQVGISLEGIQTYFEKRDIPALIRDILDAGKRAATIVTNMLNFSRHTSSGMMPASIPDLIRKAVELAANDYDLKKKYDFRHIGIVYEFDPAVPPVPCIESKLEQVILNLLKNAAQAIGEHGSTRTPTITCRVMEEPGFVRFEIEDNGPGMPEDIRRRVFEPFFTTKEVGTGTGLGLSVSYFIVKENHAGTMTVESVPGEGTRFIVRIPLQRTSVARSITEA